MNNLQKVIGISLLVFLLSVGYYFVIYLPTIQKNQAEQQKTEKKLQQAKGKKEYEEKKQELIKFYNKIALAQSTQDWAKMYELEALSVRENLNKDDYIKYYKNKWKSDGIYSLQFKIQKVNIDDDSGIIERTVIICLNEQCTGENLKEELAKRKYDYAGGKWQLPDPQPSERALKAVTYAYSDVSDQEKKEIRNRFGYGSENYSFALRNWAVYLDSDLTKLIGLETQIEKSKAENSRPILNVEGGDSVYNNSRSCISRNVGSMVFTDCN